MKKYPIANKSGRTELSTRIINTQNNVSNILPQAS